MRILVVEDEVRLASTLEDILTAENYLVDLSYDGISGLDNALSGIYDGMILDVMLPGMDGFQVVRRMRREGCSLPVLMLTAKTDVGDRVNGLDQGADYYLTKPFEQEELLACLRALLRRQGEVVQEELEYGGVILNLQTCVLRYGSHSTRLSSREFEIMRLLLTNKESIIPKGTILLKVWGYESSAEDNVVEVYISFLRKKLHHIKAPVQIEAVRRMGYHLQLEEKTEGEALPRKEE